jgi:hypothetical protein
MYSEMDPSEGYDTMPPRTGSWSDDIGGSHTGITPPRLEAISPTAAQPASALSVADLRLPTEVVRARAEGYASRARTQGVPHSMRLWRQCFEQAITALAREASQVPADATCEALFWQQKDDDYWISVTFGRGHALPTLH